MTMLKNKKGFNLLSFLYPWDIHKKSETLDLANIIKKICRRKHQDQTLTVFSPFKIILSI